MRSATTVLSIIRERGRRGLPLQDVYRQLYNRELYLLAYGRIYRNKGAMTPGVTDEIVDGMSLAKIDNIIEQLRYERFRWKPTRRVYIEKKQHSTKNSMKKRPLGMPTWTDKLVQEVIRLLLDAYYEPQFSDHSHGFRPGRGCHTALSEIRHCWQGTTWFIEGDISQCFDKLDHQVLLQTLAENIRDNRFLRLLNGALKAGYLEEWKFKRTLSGTPQGGVVSPILANIYLDRLDKFVETTLLPAYNRGDKQKRKRTPEYERHRYRARKLREQGEWAEARAERRKQQALPSYALDPNFRRLHYVRYADDFLLGFVGPQQEAEEIKQQLGEFLCEVLKLQLSEKKTLITHARTEAARFLGYEVVVFQNDRKHTKGQRSINGRIGLKVPADVLREKCRPYMRGGKPIHRAERLNDNTFSIVALYQSEYRGIVNYYQMAYNLSKLHLLKWVMETSMTKTLAHKLKVSVNKVYRRYSTQVETPYGLQKGLQVTIQTAQREEAGKKPLVAMWGGIPLRWKGHGAQAVLNDNPPKVWNDQRTEMVQRLLADTCELCGSHEKCQVHHIKAMKNLQKQGRGSKPAWITQMAARRRKTLIVCQTCHYDIHYPESRQGAKNEGTKARKHEAREANTEC